MSLIAPHGGKLVNRVVDEAARSRAESDARSLPSITLSPREAFDLEMIAIGAFSPLTGFQGQADFERVCRELCDFVLREMTDKGGGFNAAIDADSEDEEGKFYRWEKAELTTLLAADEYELLAQIYGLTETTPLRRGDMLQDFYSTFKDMHDEVRARAQADMGAMEKALQTLRDAQNQGDYRGEARGKLTEALDALEKHVADRKGKLTDFPPRNT